MGRRRSAGTAQRLCMEAPDTRCIFRSFDGGMCTSDTVMERFQKKEMDEKDLKMLNRERRVRRSFV